MSLAVIIPALNAETRMQRLLAAIQAQTRKPQEILVVDSNSRDATTAVALHMGARVLPLGAAIFNHGGTRQWALEKTSADIVIFLTDDAFPTDNGAFEILCANLEQVPDAGMAYGRQVPNSGATLFARHHRGFNYPVTPAIRRKADIVHAGTKTFFASNSFAAYKRDALQSVGGFPRDTIFGEDAYVAARMILAGYAVVYAADATVSHSHNYTLAQEFRRYFDAGVFHARNPWLKRNFGGPNNEGFCFVKSELAFLVQHAGAHLIPYAVSATAAKFLGFHIGLLEQRIPVWLKRRLGLYRGYWS